MKKIFLLIPIILILIIALCDITECSAQIDKMINTVYSQTNQKP